MWLNNGTINGVMQYTLTMFALAEEATLVEGGLKVGSVWCIILSMQSMPSWSVILVIYLLFA